MLTEILPIPAMALAPNSALHGNLKPVRRQRIGRRIRVCYIVSTEKKLVIVLYVGQRKDGDSSDVYAELARLIRKGTFDSDFLEAGISKPSC